jgi:predicted AlkP superfamily phosphohydrolase/phosphomutase
LAADSSGTVTRVDAFPPGPFGGLLRVNQAGRDFQGQIPRGAASQEVRRKLADKLATLVEPETGQPFVEHVYRREELYTGPYVENGPDLVFVEAPTFFVGRGSPSDTAMFGPPSFTFSGFHRQEGILLAAGPRFRREPERRRASILDIAPTNYWLFGVESPKDLDGEVLAELVRPDSLARRPPKVGEATAVIPPSDVRAETESDREVLKSLGYVQ